MRRALGGRVLAGRGAEFSRHNREGSHAARNIKRPFPMLHLSVDGLTKALVGSRPATAG